MTVAPGETSLEDVFIQFMSSSKDNMAMNTVFSFARLGALLTKEFIQMRRDRITFAMMLGVPLMQLRAVRLRHQQRPEDPARRAGRHQQRPLHARHGVGAGDDRLLPLRPSSRTSAAEAEALMAKGDVLFVVTIPSDFARRVERGDKPRILIEADATDPAAASGAISTLGTVASQALLREQGMEAAAAENAGNQLDVVVHRRYNPEGISQYNIVPGLLGVILQMTMVMMTSIALTRETERGTMENLLAMPASPLEIMLGKVLPYLVVGAVQVAVVLAAAKLLFARALRRLAVAAARRHLRLRAGAGAARLHYLHGGAHADAGDAAHLLLLPAVDPAVGLHVPLSRHARLGAGASARSCR